MKKEILSILFFVVIVVTTSAQVPDAFNYQTVVRNTSGEIIAGKTISFKISILQDSENGSVVYAETHSARTNNFGLANLKIGKGTVVSGSFSTIDWGSSTHFIKIEIDPNGGSSFTHAGTSQLLSVPYALHAKTVSIDKVDDADADPTNEIQSISISGTQLTLSKGGGTVTLPSSGGGDNWGTQTVVSDATLSGKGTTASPLSVVGTLTDNQTLSLSGNNLTISGGNTVALPVATSSPWLTGTGTIYTTTGKVGIGTSAPVSSLDIFGQTGTPYLTFHNSLTGTTASRGLMIGLNDANSSAWLMNNENTPLYFGTNGTTQMTLTEEGKLAVGTITPNAYGTLAIYGKNKNAWMTFNNDATGNTQTDGLIIGPTLDNSVAYIWNMENTPIVFATNNKQQMVIKETGKVCIGADNPNSNGMLTVNGKSENAWISFNNNATGNAASDGMIIGPLANNSAVYFWNLENTPIKTATNNQVRMTVAANGYVGFGTESPSAGLHLKGTGFPGSFMYIEASSGNDAGIRLYEGSTAKWHIFNNSALDGLQIYNAAGKTALFASQANSYVGIGTTSPTEALYVVGNAYKTVGGSTWLSSSDIRLKNLKGDYTKGLNEIAALKPVKYVYKENNPRQLNSTEVQVGFVAQDVQKVFPEAVTVGKDGYLDLNIHPINIAVVNAIKELKAENDRLTAKVGNLESRLEQIESLLKASASK